MRFAEWPMVYWLGVSLAAVFFLLWAKRRRESLRNKFAQENLFNQLISGADDKTEVTRIILIALVGIFSIISLMRPQWGFTWREVKRMGLDILVAVDVSKSMLTQDVKPNRLERSKLAVKDLVKRLEGDRIGLVAFAGDAFLVCPLTIDYPGFLMTLDSLSPDIVSQGGTSISAAISEASRSFKSTPGRYKALVILTDGEDLEGDVAQWAKKAKEEGLKIFTVGIGTKEGELIQLTNETGEKEFLKDRQGNFVKSRLNENVLQETAATTGGVYVRSGGARFGLDVIYDEHLSKMEKREIKAQMEKRYFERFQIPLFLAFVFLLWETLLTVRRIR
ncbi:MAG: hypothetical protein A2Z88_10070 [Omnitrophica WOR_2 bacterium GWA2_47_8]|nr:MAG: hypothetical protein A2Z88_10070 [Omnitrophica WOR_2 bacterium GWA2_47_8]